MVIGVSYQQIYNISVNKLISIIKISVHISVNSGFLRC
jgi:hypothetical protein